jgi:UPF0755 protein
MFPNQNETEPKNKKKKNWIANVFLIVGFLALFVYYFLFAPFGNINVTIHISNGQSINSVATKLKEEKAVRSDFALKVFIRLLKSGRGIISGDYLIEKSSPVWVVAWQIGRGHHNIEPIKVIIREGLTNDEIAGLLGDKLAGFRRDLFMTSVSGKQGYLFPDTYFFFPLDSASEIEEKLSSNFETRIKSLMPAVSKSGKSLNEIITMASILQGEAGGEEDAGIISGILWRRISLGMSLQVDIDKSTYSIKGLPAKPLNNPGLIPIKAAINPINSSYLYYLHDKNGNVHYAMTYEEHKSNIAKYLK